jgi:hypothetical protein
MSSIIHIYINMIQGAAGTRTAIGCWLPQPFQVIYSTFLNHLTITVLSHGESIQFWVLSFVNLSGKGLLFLEGLYIVVSLTFFFTRSTY